MNLKGNNDEFGFAGTHEYSLVYMKYKDSVFDLNGVPLTEEDKTEYTLSDENIHNLQMYIHGAHGTIYII